MNVTRQPYGLKFVIGWVLALGLRLIPFRPPNFEPILATQMPFSKRFGAWPSFVFAAANIAIYDLVTGKLGQWTLITAVAYGLLALIAAPYFKKRSSVWNYAVFAVIGTILYDAVTGLSIGPLFFGQPFAEAFFGQIPFTLYHLLGNTALAITLSPAIERWITANDSLRWPVSLSINKARI